MKRPIWSAPGIIRLARSSNRWTRPISDPNRSSGPIFLTLLMGNWAFSHQNGAEGTARLAMKQALRAVFTEIRQIS